MELFLTFTEVWLLRLVKKNGYSLDEEGESLIGIELSQDEAKT